MHNSVTVCIPTCFENQKYLMKLLISISNQVKLPDETLIIVNSKKYSNESISKLISEFSSEIPENINYKFIITDKVGLSHARNLGIDNCKTDILIFGDDDDLWHEEKISLIYKEIYDKGTSLVRHNFNLLINNIQKPAKNKFRLSPNLFLIGVANFGGGGSNISGSTCIFKTLKFNESLFSCEDWDFWIRAFLSRIKIFTIPRVLVTYRVHGRRMTKNKLKIMKYDFSVRLRYFVDLFFIFLGLILGLFRPVLKILTIYFNKNF